MQNYKNIWATIFLALSLTSVSYAHEGHETPGSIKANHGGIVKPGKEINLEYVVSGTEVTLYPLDHDGKDLPASEVKLTATSKIPKGKVEQLTIESTNGFKTNVDFKGAYRSEVVVTSEVKGKKDTFKFQVEKQ